MGVGGGAARVTLALGNQQIEIIQFDEPGMPYPFSPHSTDIFFQHFAIVVRDIAQARDRLWGVDDWNSITLDGPQTLPANTGGVTAFKFRDPDGHPLELLQFRADRMPAAWQGDGSHPIFLGIDHSAIGVARIDDSVRFYERLGMRRSAASLNVGSAQERLDDIRHPDVDVIAMSPEVASPHLELLHYRDTVARAARIQSNDVAATRLIIARNAGGAVNPTMLPDLLLIDPDGHRLHLVSDVR